MSIPHANADAKVREIVRRYRPIEELHPVVSEMYDDPEFERMFWDCLAHDSLVIRRRSQNLADGEITAVQKAFRILMDDKKDGLAAIELYVDEIIGLEVVSETDRAQMLATTLQTRDYILNQSRGRQNLCSSAIAAKEQIALPNADNYCTQSSENTRISGRQRRSHERSLFVSDDSEASSFSRPIVERGRKLTCTDLLSDPNAKPEIAGTGNKMFRKLFLTYQDAKEDFHSTSKKSLERTKSAKWLRDTAENCLTYLAARIDSPGSQEPFDNILEVSDSKAAVSEMKLTLQEATEAAEEGSGGKKRRFDEDWTSIPEAPATMRPSTIHKALPSRDPVPRGTVSDRYPRGKFIPQRIEKQSPPKTGYRSRRAAQIDRIPRGLYPVSAGQGTRRVFPMPTQGSVRHAASPSLGFGDCYRPAYK